MIKFWLLVTDEKNWKIIKNRNFYAFKEKNVKQFNEVKLDDEVVIYVKRKKIGGIFIVKSKEESKRVLFGDENYKYKFGLKKKIIGKDLIELTDTFINKISVFKNKSRWGTVLMGRAIIKISRSDMDYIYKLIKLCK